MTRPSIAATLGLLLAGCACGDDDGSGDEDASVCPASNGRGTIVITVNGPGGAPLAVSVTAADGSSEAVTGAGVIELPAGLASVDSRRTRAPGALVGTVYSATPDASEICIEPGGSANLRLTVAADPASNRLWITDPTGSQVMGIAAADLAATGSPAPAAVLTGTFTNAAGAAFGPDGTLWMIDQGRVAGYASADLAAGGAVQPAIALDGADVRGGGPPGPVDLAFDRNGSLWVANATSNRVVRLAPQALAASGEPTASGSVSGPSIVSPRSIAFDGEGNLWIAGDSESLVMFDGSRLAQSPADAADITIRGMTAQPEEDWTPLGGATAIAFDSDGGMWVAHVGVSLVARYSQDNRLQPGDVAPNVQVQVPADLALTNLAVDEEAGLWLTGAAGQVARLGPSQLRPSGDRTPATILTPTGLGTASSLAVYPAGAGSPIPY